MPELFKVIQRHELQCNTGLEGFATLQFRIAGLQLGVIQTIVLEKNNIIIEMEIPRPRP